MVTQLLSNQTTNGSSDTITLARTRKDGVGIFQAKITGTATVTLQGRLGPTFPWADIVALTASDAKVIALFPQMRATVSGIGASSSVDAAVSD